jgi:YYY domain-containing protein
LIVDWLAREGAYVVSWWALATAAGAAALPLCARLLGGLPDRGYTLARAVGMLLVGYVFWLLASLGFVRNTTGSMLLAWLIVLGVGVAAYMSGQRLDVRAWLRHNRVVVIVGEVLFLGLFVAWAFIRAHYPDTWSTEKPMDLMMMSAIMRSSTFPPNDAWMAGYAISYYYFGYLLAAMMGKLSGAATTITYSLHLALLFALTALGAFGVVCNLVRAKGQRLWEQGSERQQPGSEHATPALLAGLLAAFLVVLAGNYQAPLIEVPYQARLAPEGYLAFFDTQERDEYPERAAARANGIPDDQPVMLSAGRDMLSPAYGGDWWWFRSARVIQDRDLNGLPVGAQPIDEFPQFSFILGDSHPHVMALPFVLLAIGLALNLTLRGRAPSRAEIVFYALVIGGLIFLNTWDGPIYLLMLVGAEAVRRLLRPSARLRGDVAVQRAPLDRHDWLALIGFGVTVGALALLFYLPFLVGFRSQAGGLLPNWTHPTLFRQFFIMFGPFVLILPLYLAVEAWRGGERMNWPLGGLSALSLLAGLLLMMAFLSVIAALVIGFPAGNWALTIPEIIVKRVTHGFLSVVLLAGIAVVIARLFARADAGEPMTPAYDTATAFTLLLIGVGLGLTLLPDYVYLRDVFGVRMNTVFKFYYQAWVVFSLASAFAVHSLLSAGAGVWREITPVVKAACGSLAALALALSSVYPFLAIYNRSLQESGRITAQQPVPLSLDGGPAHFIRGDSRAEDYDAIQCLARIVAGDDAVVVEAVEGTYNPNFGRVAALTGIPVLFNWPGHQRQWRGATYDAAAGTREADIQTLYTTDDWALVESILARYGIDYVFFGRSERSKYSPAAETKFRDHLSVVCAYGDSRFYVAGR